MPLWQRLAVLGAVLLLSAIAARIIDRKIARRALDPAAETRYRVVRRSVTMGVMLVGVLSALLVIPQVRALAGGLLASSAIVGLVVGFASRSTIGNWVAGVTIAFTQPLRLGDQVEVGGVPGVVEEIGLTYTFIRTRDNARIVIPNEKLASDTIRNSTIVSREKLAEVALQVPLGHDLRTVVDILREATAGERDAQVLVTGLEAHVTVTLRAWAPDEIAAEQLESELRVRAHDRLRQAGLLA